MPSFLDFVLQKVHNTWYEYIEFVVDFGYILVFDLRLGFAFIILHINMNFMPFVDDIRSLLLEIRVS